MSVCCWSEDLEISVRKCLMNPVTEADDNSWCKQKKKNSVLQKPVSVWVCTVIIAKLLCIVIHGI